MKKRKAKCPAPWFVHVPAQAYSGRAMVRDANSVDVLGWCDLEEAHRLSRAVNAYESPLARAERGLLRAVDRWLGTSNMDGKNNERLAAVGVAHECLLKARAKARGSK